MDPSRPLSPLLPRHYPFLLPSPKPRRRRRGRPRRRHLPKAASVAAEAAEKTMTRKGETPTPPMPLLPLLTSRLSRLLPFYLARRTDGKNWSAIASASASPSFALARVRVPALRTSHHLCQRRQRPTPRVTWRAPPTVMGANLKPECAHVHTRARRSIGNENNCNRIRCCRFPSLPFPPPS